MASRGGGSGALIATIVITIILTVTLFITTVIYYSKFSAASEDLAAMSADVRKYIADDERQRTEFQQVLAEAQSPETRQANNGRERTAMAHLYAVNRDLVQLLTASPRDDLSSVRQKIAALNVPASAGLVRAVQDQKTEIDNLNRRIATLEGDAARARQDQQNEVKRVGELQSRQQDTVSRLTDQIETYKGEIDSLRSRVNQLGSAYEQSRGQIEADYQARIAAIQGELDNASAENLRLTEEIRKARAGLDRVGLGKNEEALVDGIISAVSGNANEVTINLGWKDKVRLGMSFAVYNAASSIAPNKETGEYSRGKASVEVIRVGERTSTARVISGDRGNPIIAGDVIANAAYDPRKVYKFVVFGLFDVDGDGYATEGEMGTVVAMLNDWGGQVSTELGGEIDFLILGQKPFDPPPPPIDARREIIEEYQRNKQARIRYEELYDEAVKISIPLLNENRLRTLIGKPGDMR